MDVETQAQTIAKFPRAHVNNMEGRNGRAVPNQFEIHTDAGVFFQSYRSIIAFIPNDRSSGKKIVLDRTYWDYSTTTGKYRNMFLGEKRDVTESKIRKGEYVLADLN